MQLPSILQRTIPLVLCAGEMVRAEFLRPDGPRGSGHKAPVDTEIELFLCGALRGVLRVPFVGEETPPVLDGDPSLCWLVDPHDGTSEFLRGARGSSVSVALLRDGVPVLGVVHAPLSPDRGSDLIGWAEGMDHLIRNGIAIRPELASRGLTGDEIVLLAYRSYARPATNMRRVAPARFVSSNSVAYRLARVAAGDAVATASRQAGLSAYDYAAGHALLRGAGCVLLDGAGNPPVYGPNGTGGMDKCFAGAPAAVDALLGRDWSLGQPPETPLPERITLSPPRIEDGLDRAIGCLAGLAIGEAPGPGGFPGQPGPGMEAALILARALIASDELPAASRAVEPVLRCAPFGIGRRPSEAASRAVDDARRTHREEKSVLASAALAAAVATAVAGGSRDDMLRAALDAATAQPDSGVLRALRASNAQPSQEGDRALFLLQSGFFHLMRGTPIAEIRGADPIAGALLGAVGGRGALPPRDLLDLLSCRPLAAFGARRPRPPACWADDLPLLAEALLKRASPRAPGQGRG
jgi:fructose-1,6-bisphosphatase/inositol monophosphatase family enzyme